MMHFLGVVSSFLRLAMQQWTRWLLLGLIMLLNVACAGTIPESTLATEVLAQVCARDPDIEPTASMWAYSSDNGQAVSSLHPREFREAVGRTGVVYRYNSASPPESLRMMPARYSTLPCDEPNDLREALRGELCRRIALVDDQAPNRSNLFGQASEPTIRSRLVCGARDAAWPDPKEMALKRAVKDANITGALVGEVWGLVIGQANSDMTALINKSDGWLVKIYRKSPKSIDDLMSDVAAKLEQLPPLPEYENREMAEAAQAAFEKAFGAEVAQIDAEIYLLEATEAAVELAVMEVALGPMGGATALRAALSRLRNIPVFIPGAAGGLGGIYKITAAATRTVLKPSARRLAAAMKRAKIPRPDNTVPHHIVAHGAEKAKETLAILEKFGIGVDDAVNGVYLPPTEELAKKMGTTAHNTLHSHKYYEKVHEVLKDLTSRAEVENALQIIAKKLRDGVFM